jgi:tetratricopeptide (TPR) repeat protein
VLLNRLLLICLGALLLVLPDEGVDPLLLAGQAHVAAGEFALAVGDYGTVVGLDPSSPVAHLGLGLVHLAKHRYAAAEAELQSALRGGSAAGEESPLVGQALAALGDVYAATGRPLQAADSYRRGVDHGCRSALYPLALTYLRLGELRAGGEVAGLLSAGGDPRAAPVLDLLRSLTSPASAGDAYAAVLVGSQALRQDLPAVARAAFGEAVRRSPTYAQAHAYFGYSLYLLGDLDAAQGVLTQALPLAPDDPLAHHFLGLVYGAQGQAQQALTELETARIASPQDAALLDDLGEAYAVQKDYAQALEALIAATRADATSAVPWLRLARFHLDYLLDITAGLAAAQEAARLDPLSPDAADLVGWGLHLNQQPAEALAALRRAVDLNPASASAQYHLGVVAAQAGETAIARRAYQRAVDLDVTNIYEPRAERALILLPSR